MAEKASTDTTQTPSKAGEYLKADAETGARKPANLKTLKSEFGAKEGERIYFELSRLGGHGITPQNPTDTYPDLSLTGMKKEDIEQAFAPVKE